MQALRDEQLDQLSDQLPTAVAGHGFQVAVYVNDSAIRINDGNAVRERLQELFDADGRHLLPYRRPGRLDPAMRASYRTLSHTCGWLLRAIDDYTRPSIPWQCQPDTRIRLLAAGYPRIRVDESVRGIRRWQDSRPCCFGVSRRPPGSRRKGDSKLRPLGAARCRGRVFEQRLMPCSARRPFGRGARRQPLFPFLAR